MDFVLKCAFLATGRVIHAGDSPAWRQRCCPGALQWQADCRRWRLAGVRESRVVGFTGLRRHFLCDRRVGWNSLLPVEGIGNPPVAPSRFRDQGPTQPVAPDQFRLAGNCLHRPHADRCRNPALIRPGLCPGSTRLPVRSGPGSPGSRSCGRRPGPATAARPGNRRGSGA